MLLHDFLLKNREDILNRSEIRTVALGALRPVSNELQRGLPIFFDQMIEILKKDKTAVSLNDERKILHSSGEHGKELLRLGYTLTHVVHAYGAICQAVTEAAHDLKAPVTAKEFHNLNRCLDIAIAGAVTEFEAGKSIETKAREVQHLGMLAHELRNALNRATVASEMIAKGFVGNSGSTARVLQCSLKEMHYLLNRSLSEIKHRSKTEVYETCFTVIEVVSHLLVTAELEAAARGQTITVDVDTSLQVKTDRYLVLAALGNLLQNALKYSCDGGKITIHARAKDDKVEIAVLDECGGISPKIMKEIFKPFTQFNEDKSGLGLGLSIAREALEHCGGDLSATNTKLGCSMKITLPRFKDSPEPPKSIV
jgi:signal transduction histidine kinase